MSILLALLPACAFVVILIFILTRYSEIGMRQAILRTYIVYGCWIVVTLELLSLIKGITRVALVLAWLMPIILFVFWAREKQKKKQPLRFPYLCLPTRWTEWILLVGIMIIGVTTLIVAWMTPPQTWDSLSYHLTRVAHWAQNQSLGHFATGINRQVSMSPGAEIQSLTFYVLSQSDQFANLPQWLAMIGSIIGASLIARQLGSQPVGEWIAAFFVATLPIGIVEASSTITDYVATFWLICVAVETLAYSKKQDKISLYFVALAAGLAILTKPITAPYLLPFACWIAILLVRRNKWVTILQTILLAMILIFAINGGYLARNLMTYGAFSNPLDFRTHLNELRTPQGFLSNIIKHSALHAGLPNLPAWNDSLNTFIEKAHIKLKVEIQDPRTTGDGTFKVRPPSTQEDLAGNPYHAYLILLLIIFSIVLLRKVGWTTFLYGFGITASFLIFCMFFKWHVFSTRYHLAFFVLFAPVSGVVLSVFDKIRLGNIISLGLLFTSLPWLLSIDSRPLIPIEGTSRTESILMTPRDELYYANAGGSEPFKKIAENIQAIHCNQVGIMLNGDDPEYLFWHVLGAPRQNLNIDWIVADVTTKYEQVDYKPCAVICNNCNMTEIRGNKLFNQFGVWQLYMNPK